MHKISIGVLGLFGLLTLITFENFTAINADTSDAQIANAYYDVYEWKCDSQNILPAQTANGILKTRLGFLGSGIGTHMDSLPSGCSSATVLAYSYPSYGVVRLEQKGHGCYQGCSPKECLETSAPEDSSGIDFNFSTQDGKLMLSHVIGEADLKQGDAAYWGSNCAVGSVISLSLTR